MNFLFQFFFLLFLYFRRIILTYSEMDICLVMDYGPACITRKRAGQTVGPTGETISLKKKLRFSPIFILLINTL